MASSLPGETRKASSPFPSYALTPFCSPLLPSPLALSLFSSPFPCHAPLFSTHTVFGSASFPLHASVFPCVIQWFWILIQGRWHEGGPRGFYLGGCDHSFWTHCPVFLGRCLSRIYNQPAAKLLGHRGHVVSTQQHNAPHLSEVTAPIYSPTCSG